MTLHGTGLSLCIDRSPNERDGLCQRTRLRALFRSHQPSKHFHSLPLIAGFPLSFQRRSDIVGFAGVATSLWH